MALPLGYRMDRFGTIFVRYLDGSERPATRPEVLEILTRRLDVAATLARPD